MGQDHEQLIELSKKHPIVFFDGVCGLCNGVVDWIIARDPVAYFRFSPLQGEAAFLSLSETDRRDLDTVIVFKNAAQYKRSSAVVEILLDMDFKWRVIGHVLKLIPGPLRDMGYRIVAKIRYKIFGKREFCRLPTPDERTRFLD